MSKGIMGGGGFFGGRREVTGGRAGRSPGRTERGGRGRKGPERGFGQTAKSQTRPGKGKGLWW
jgi:hypothetical protein